MNYSKARIWLGAIALVLVSGGLACSHGHQGEFTRAPADQGADEDAFDVDASAPDPALPKDNHVIHKIRERYAAALRNSAALESCAGRKIDPLKIKDVAARGFINRPDWENYLSDVSHILIDPSEVYSPAPVTWDNWWEVQNKVRLAAIKRTPLSLELLEDWNHQALDQTGIEGGHLKSTPNYGQNVTRGDALSRDEIQAIEKFLVDDKPILQWTYLVCREELPQKISLPGENEECQQTYSMAKQLAPTNAWWKQTLDDMDAGKVDHVWYWYACWPRAQQPRHKKELSCGMIAYPPSSMAKGYLQQLVEEVNQYFDPNNKKAHPEDPLHFAMRIQQQAVALHPFPKGNGRNSRYLQDYIIFRAGLPPLQIPNMNKDLSTPLKEYAKQGKHGMLESLGLIEKCLGEYTQACGENDETAPWRSVSIFESIQESKCGVLR